MLSQSYYFNFIKKNSWFILVSIILAGICTAITYPGIWYPDTYMRIDHYVNNLINNFTSNDIFYITSIHAWFPSLLMAFSKMLTGAFGVYTFIKASIYFFITFCLINKLDTKYKIIQYILVVINPLLFCLSVWDIPGLGCIIGIAMYILILYPEQQKNTFDKIVDVILLFLAGIITFGFRLNSFTIIPVLLYYIFHNKTVIYEKCIKTLTIIISLFIILISPKLLNITIMPHYCSGFLWEMLYAISTSENNKHIDYLDDLGGKGATAEVVKMLEDDYLNSFIYRSKLSIGVIHDNHAGKYILKKYLKLAVKDPVLFFKTKLYFISRDLGINKPLIIYALDYNEWDRMDEYGFNDSDERMFFIDIYKQSLTNSILIRIPLILFLITLILYCYAKNKKHKNIELYSFIFLLAIFYYGSFIITTHSFEVRYFYPSFYLMLIMDTAIIFDIVDYFISGKKTISK